MKTVSSLGAICLASGVLVACGEEQSIEDFEGYGSGQPGTALEEGGEALLERIKLNIGGELVAQYSTFHAYQYTPASTATLPPAGVCSRIDAGTVWPTNLTDGAHVDWGASIRLTSASGLDLEVPKQVAADGATLIDNRPNYNRAHPFLYGGPGWQEEAMAFDDVVPGETYAVEIGDQSFDIVFPPEHTSPYGIGTSATPVEVPTSGDWEVTWDAVGQVEGATHSRAHHFTFLAFARIDDSGPIGMYLCPAAEDGSVTVPADVIATLPDSGIIQHGRLTHYMEAVDGRRFDLVAIDCTIGAFAKAAP